jgi:ABC-2 type transport system permease protein
MEVFYWPLLNLLVWGFMTVYLARYRQNLPGFVTFFIGALILWDILFRSQTGISVAFLEDVWAKNFLNLFASPLKPTEYLTALMMLSAAKIVTISTAMTLLAWLVYSFNIFILGMSLVPFVLNLIIMGWAIGIFTIALILRFGQEAEVLAWALGFLFMPVSAVFYPVDVLPPFLRFVARGVPSSYVFEGMREVILNGHVPAQELIWAFVLNGFYILGALCFFRWNFRAVKNKGLLVRIGE